MKTFPKNLVIIGIDPGLRNTAISGIAFEGEKKTLLDSNILKSVSRSHKKYRPDGQVLCDIAELLQDRIELYSMCNANIVVAIESVFHTPYLTSAVQTGKVIGICHQVAAKNLLPCVEVSPTEVKKALGLSTKSKKEEIVNRAEKLLGVKLESHHMADSCGVAFSIWLKMKKAAVEGTTIEDIDFWEQEDKQDEVLK